MIDIQCPHSTVGGVFECTQCVAQPHTQEFCRLILFYKAVITKTMVKQAGLMRALQALRNEISEGIDPDTHKETLKPGIHYDIVQLVDQEMNDYHTLGTF